MVVITAYLCSDVSNIMNTTGAPRTALCNEGTANINDAFFFFYLTLEQLAATGQYLQRYEGVWIRYHGRDI